MQIARLKFHDKSNVFYSQYRKTNSPITEKEINIYKSKHDINVPHEVIYETVLDTWA